MDPTSHADSSWVEGAWRECSLRSPECHLGLGTTWASQRPYSLYPAWDWIFHGMGSVRSWDMAQGQKRDFEVPFMRTAH